MKNGSIVILVLATLIPAGCMATGLSDTTSIGAMQTMGEDAGTVLAGTATPFALDESGRAMAQRNQSALGDAVFGFGREYGRVMYGLSASAGLYAGGLIFHDRAIRETGLLMLESIAFAVTSVLAARVKNTAASIVLYAVAGLTAVSRVYDDARWISGNILAGVARER